MSLRQTFIEQTNERTFTFIELLTEPKISKNANLPGVMQDVCFSVSDTKVLLKCKL